MIIIRMILPLIILSILSCKGKKENNYLLYYHKINEATYLNFQKSYEKADSLYKEAFRLVDKPFYSDYLKASKNAKYISDENVFEYLEKAIERGLRLALIKEDSLLNKLAHTREWEKLIKNYDKKRKLYEQTINLSLRDELLCMYEIDQLVRTNPEEVEKSMFQVDKENLEDLLAIIAEFDYPGNHVVGEEVGEKFSIMFHHFYPKENSKYFYELLQEAMLKGEISPFRNAAFRDYDRIKMRKKTLYGTYHSINNGQRILNPVEDYGSLNARRYEMGLSPIEQDMEMRGIVYNPDF